MDRPKVAVVRCPGYRAEFLSAALGRALELIGGLGRILNPRARVFVKVNHLSSFAPPERAINTHPDFVRQTVQVLLDHGAEVAVGDDIASTGDDGFVATGYRRVCAGLGVRLVNLKETGFAEVAIRGSVLDRAYIARPVLEADFLVNLPKLKTHSFAVFSGAVKNMYGVIPLGLRHDFHRRYIRNDVFSQMLVDLFSAVPPHLTVMDAVVGMEGEGPSGGKPKPIGLILAGVDGVAVDAVATKIVGYDPAEVFTTAHAGDRKIGVADLRQIDVVGERIQDVAVKDFRPSAAAVKLFRKKIPSLLYAIIQDQLVLIPEVLPDVCTACQECVRICPRGAVRLVGRAAWVDEEECIHCLCCHEVCPHLAIRLKQLPVGRLISIGSGAGRRLKALFRRAAGGRGEGPRDALRNSS
jgi:uncharacterized protein (DUF362 family)/NAD-dependent dihydropyrimidine dehydrogenase PreA subunit